MDLILEKGMHVEKIRGAIVILVIILLFAAGFFSKQMRLIPEERVDRTNQVKYTWSHISDMKPVPYSHKNDYR